ncbi:MAG: hypothetical protein ACD_33C00014G0004 [uncultured bacterium]|nr:MAG: hypothetical protein ACD_33C00014G0004 [uncultured bacterium]
MNTKQPISNTPGGLLVKLKDKILLNLEIDLFKLKYLIDNFVVNNFNGIENSSKVHFAKVNLYNEFTKNRMTIKVFFKFLHIIKIKQIKFTITLTTVNNKTVEVSEEIAISHFLEDDEKEGGKND